MRQLLLIITALVAMSSTYRTGSGKALNRWVVESSSSLNIEGSSNINDFRCDITEYIMHDTLCYNKEDRTSRLAFINSCVTLDVKRFDCHHKYITNDLRKTLKADQYPLLKIHFLFMDNFSADADKSKVTGTIDIALAGVVKRTQVQFLVKKGEGRIHLTGEKHLKFSDFGLVPPRKLAGLIRINEEITVNFLLKLRPI
ncbi:MAG: YceI family protein [Chitinophagaceae bacterium]|nr:YceI family protein [Chitinophagaceae bacterium]